MAVRRPETWKPTLRGLAFAAGTLAGVLVEIGACSLAGVDYAGKTCADDSSCGDLPCIDHVCGVPADGGGRQDAAGSVRSEEAGDDGSLDDEAVDGSILGDPCSDDGGDGATQCAVGTCYASWCSMPCHSFHDTTSCGSNSMGETNYCVFLQAPLDGSFFMCFPGCSVNSDCVPYANTTCQPNGAGDPPVGAPPGSSSCGRPGGLVGDPCRTSGDCAKDAGALTCADSWCSKSCTSLSDTHCGKSSTLQANHCVATDGATPYTCAPGCTSNDDCTPYLGTFCVPIGHGEPGFVCAHSGGLLGDPCFGNSDCVQGQCTNGDWCDEACADAGSTECGLNSVGIPNECITTDAGSRCAPGCTADSDCTPYRSTVCELDSGVGVCTISYF